MDFCIPQFKSLSQQNSAMARKQPRLQADADTQTDTHIMAPYIDKEYEWNEWEMRRKGTFSTTQF